MILFLQSERRLKQPQCAHILVRCFSMSTLRRIWYRLLRQRRFPGLRSFIHAVISTHASQLRCFLFNSVSSTWTAIGLNVLLHDKVPKEIPVRQSAMWLSEVCWYPNSLKVAGAQARFPGKSLLSLTLSEQNNTDAVPLSIPGRACHGASVVICD